MLHRLFFTVTICLCSAQIGGIAIAAADESVDPSEILHGIGVRGIVGRADPSPFHDKDRRQQQSHQQHQHQHQQILKNPPSDFNSEEDVPDEIVDEPYLLTSIKPEIHTSLIYSGSNVEAIVDSETEEDDGCYDDNTMKDHYTFVALIDIMFPDGCKRTCTGSIIHDNVVLTAAHCFTMVTNKFVQPELSLSFVVIGTQRMFETGYEQYLPIERVITHPRFRGWTADLGLVYTFANMNSDKPGQILPLALEKASVPVDSNVTVLSWGKCKSDLDENMDADHYEATFVKDHHQHTDTDNDHPYKWTTMKHHDNHHDHPDHPVTRNSYQSNEEDHIRAYQRHGDKKLNIGGQYDAHSKIAANIGLPAKPVQYKNWNQPSNRLKGNIERPESRFYVENNIENQKIQQYADYKPPQTVQGKSNILQQRQQIYGAGQLPLESYDNSQHVNPKQTGPPQYFKNYHLQKQRADYDQQQQRQSKGMASSYSEEKNGFSSVFDTDDETNGSIGTLHVQKVERKKAYRRPQQTFQLDKETRRGQEVEPVNQPIETFFDLQDYDGQNFASLSANKTGQRMGDESFLEMIKNTVNLTKKDDKATELPLNKTNNNQRIENKESSKSKVDRKGSSKVKVDSKEGLKSKSEKIKGSRSKRTVNKQENLSYSNQGKSYINTQRYDGQRSIESQFGYKPQQRKHFPPTINQGNLDKGAFQYYHSGNGKYVRNSTEKNKVRRQMPRFQQTHKLRHFSNWRRQIGVGHNNLTVGIFGYVNIATCKKMIERTLPPLYEIRNKHEHLCYASEEFYITNEDSGAPVVQKDQLVAVTVGGVDSDGEHVAVGIKVACFCAWIAYYLPNNDGAKLTCCHDCCSDKHKEKTVTNDAFKFRSKAKDMPNEKLQKQSKEFDEGTNYDNADIDKNPSQPEESIQQKPPRRRIKPDGQKWPIQYLAKYNGRITS